MATTPPESDDRLTDSRGNEPEQPVLSRTTDETPEQLTLLTDDCAREVLTILADGPRHGRELAETCGVSRATMYRRLNRLEAAGFITTELSYDSNGHHRKEFHLLRDRLTVTVNDGSFTVTAHTADGEPSVKHQPGFPAVKPS
jgi:predicted transcriptional regulator